MWRFVQRSCEGIRQCQMESEEVGHVGLGKGVEGDSGGDGGFSQSRFPGQGLLVSVLYVAHLWKDGGLPAPRSSTSLCLSVLFPPVSPSAYPPITWLDPASIPRGSLLSFLSPGLSSRKPPQLLQVTDSPSGTHSIEPH